MIASGTNGYNANAGYNLVTGLGTPVANLMVPDLIAYQGPGTTYAGPTVSPLQDATLYSAWANGGGTTNAFNAFDALTATGGGFSGVQSPDASLAMSRAPSLVNLTPTVAATTTSAAAIGSPFACRSAPSRFTGLPSRWPRSRIPPAGHDGRTTGRSHELVVLDRTRAANARLVHAKAGGELTECRRAPGCLLGNGSAEPLRRRIQSWQGPGGCWWLIRSWTMWPPTCSCHEVRTGLHQPAVSLSRRPESRLLWTRPVPACSSIRTFPPPRPRRGWWCSGWPPACGPPGAQASWMPVSGQSGSQASRSKSLDLTPGKEAW